MNDLERKEILSKCLTEKRFLHSLGVSITAQQLAKRFGASVEKAKVAGLLHDCARAYKVQQLFALAQKLHLDVVAIERHAPILLHARIGAVLVRTKYQIEDEEIQQAIRLHTTGGTNMSLLDKIIYLADMIEPGRDFPAVGAIRALAEENLEQAVLAAFDQSILHVLACNQVIHPDTILARNEILLKG